MSPPAAARSVSSVHSNEMSRYIFEEVNVRDQVLNATDNYELSDQDDDVNDDEFLSDGRGFINNIPIGQVFLAMLTRVCNTYLSCSSLSLFLFSHLRISFLGIGFHPCSSICAISEE